MTPGESTRPATSTPADGFEDWARKCRTQASQYWPEFERTFADLPPRLFQQGVLLKNNLTTRYSETGRFSDILSRRQDHPLLYLHFWLLDDLAIPETAERLCLERQLFLAMACSFAAVHTRETMLDEGSNFDERFMFLEHSLLQAADVHLAQLELNASPFWDFHRTCWHDYREAILAEVSSAGQGTLSPELPTERSIASRYAFTKISPAAIAIEFNRNELLPHLCDMMDHLNFVMQVLDEISTLRRDLAQQRLTYPIITALKAANADPGHPVSSERILGALVVSGSMEKIAKRCQIRLDQAADISKRLDLPSFTTYFEATKSLVDQVATLFSIRTQPANTDPTPSPRTFFVPSVDTLPKVIDMAGHYLTADLTFGESWEVQRRGVFNRPELTGKAFPSGIIIEILCRHGHDMAAEVSDVFSTLHETGFRYYDHDHLPPDSDDLGLLLRLFRFSDRMDSHREVLQLILAQLNANLQPGGEIPVWLPKGKLHRPQNGAQAVSLWGNSCAAVEANLLLGLIDYDWDGWQSIIEASAHSICERLLSRGLGAASHYIPLYSIWVGLKLIAELSTKPVGSALLQKLEQARQLLAERLAVEAARYRLSAQDGAFLTLISLIPGTPESTGLYPKPDWITLICKQQRYDGSWVGEPLFGTPTRGELATWYASNPVTTAICYHALASYKTYLDCLRPSS